MTSETMVRDLVEYFHGNYSPALLREISRTCSNIPEESRARVCESIREDNAPNFKVGVKSIVEACRKLAVPFRKNEDYYIPAIDWTCDACGHAFKYAQVVSYEERYHKDIHDFCPKCGFQPCDTIEARLYANVKSGKLPDWYQIRIDAFLDGYRKRGKWAFNKTDDDEFEKKQKARLIEKMKQDAREELHRIAKSKEAL